MVELTEVEQKIFDIVVAKHDGPVDEIRLKKYIKLANVHGDGYKRVSRMGEDKVFLVPIEDFFLYGIKAWELDKYPLEEK